LRTAAAAKERAMAELAHRKRVKNRLARLGQKKATSEEAIDEATYAYEVAEANLKAARAEIDSIQSTLAETRIKVPFDAVLITEYVAVGREEKQRCEGSSVTLPNAILSPMSSPSWSCCLVSVL
jgi:multidrug resistance efflux pump